MRSRILVAVPVLLVCLSEACAGSTGPAWSPQIASTPPPVLVLVHEDDGALSIVDTTSDKIEGTLNLGRRVGAVALSSDAALIAAAVPEGIAIIDVPSRKILRTLPFPTQPASLALAGDILFVIEGETDKGTVSALALADGRVTMTRPIWGLGGRSAVSADRRRMFVPHHFYTGIVTVLETATLAERASIRFEDGAWHPQLSPDERWLLVPNGSASSGHVTIVDTATNRVAAEVPLDGHPMDLAVSPDGKRAFAPLFGDHSIAVIDIEGRKVERRIAVSQYPTRVALTADGARLFVAHNGSNRLSIVDVAKGTVALNELDKTTGDIVRPARAK